MALFEKGNPEEFLLFVWNLQMTLKDSGELATSADVQYICRLLHVEALHQIDTLSIEVGSTTATHLNRIILGLGT